MKIFGLHVPFSKNEVKQVQGTTIEVPINDALGRLLGSENGISHEDAFYYYKNCQPVATVIDIIVQALVNLPLRIEIDGEVFAQHDILKLLTAPNSDYTGHLFMQSLATYYLLTGECFVWAGGNYRRPPLSLAPINPKCVNVEQGTDGMASAFVVTGTMLANRFNRQAGTRRLFLASPLLQLKQIRNFSTQENSQLRGESKLYSVVMDIKQNMQGNKHNFNVLSKGGRLSMVFSIKEDVSPEKFLETKNAIISQFAGGQGGASIAVVNGNQIEVEELGKSNKDMDFVNLQKLTEKSIAKRYNVPLQLINDENSSYNNLSTAYEALYDNAIIPVANELLSGLSDLLFPRYDLDPGSARLFVDTSKVPAIAKRNAEVAKARRDSYIWTDNELRMEEGLETVTNGDTIYRPSTWVSDEQIEQQEARLTEEAEALQDVPKEDEA